MANALSWLSVFCSLRIFLTGTSSLSPERSIDCQTHCLIDCRQGRYYTAGNCLECPTGFYCPGGQAAPRKCPVGTANELTAQADITACQVCPNGYLSLESGAGCRACPDGYSCDPQSGVQRSCSPGQYSPEGELECRECPEGYICPDGRNRQRCLGGEEPNPSRTRCVTCALGSFSTEDTLICQPCPPGHYCPQVGTVQPLPCPPGSCTSALGQSECQRCSGNSCCSDVMGPIQHERNPSGSPGVPQCQHCPSGHSCADALTVPPCPAGSFKPREGLHTPSSSSSFLPGIGLCLKCPAGYFCPAGASYPVPCQPGTYNPLQGQDEATDCRACLAGRACTQAGLALPDSECMPGYVCPVGSSSPHSPSNACPPGTVGNQFSLFDKSQCETCPAGFVCVRGTGGRRKPPAPCPVGHYCPPGTKHPVQHKCAPGTWSNRTSLASKEECLPCPSGWFCLGGARVPSGRCSSGHYCPQGTRRGTQYPCPAGTYSTRLGNGRVEECAACPAGTFCTSGTSKPVLCPVGTFRMEHGAKSAAECIPCPGGYYCPELGTVTPRACGAGNFSGQGSTSCLPCFVGHYCASEHTSRELMLLAMICPAGLLCPEGQAVVPDASANACPRGYYCPRGDTGLQAKPCPNGTYGEQRGLSRADECLLCPAGKYCYRAEVEPSGIPHPTGDCPPGYTCPPGTGFPFSFPCVPGFSWDNSTVEGEGICIPCPAGHYCDSPAMLEPKACPVGFYCVRGSSQPEPCPEGTYSNRKGLSGPSECSPCGRGFYCAAPGQTAPSGPCNPGFYCQGRALTPLPTDGVTGDVCPAGTYCPPGSALPIPCPPGTYSNISGLRSLRQCLDCPPGLYCDGANNRAPSGPCEPGYFCTGAAKSALQQLVMEGHYSLTGAFRPEPCPLGSFQPGRGQSLCRDCPEGTFCNETGLAEPRACPRGHFCLAGSSLPLPCPVGTYTDVARAGSCKPCPAGMYCSTAGLTEPEGRCQPGYYCVQGSSSSSPVGLPFGDLCPAGHYCPAGTTHPKGMPCPAGTWNEERGARDATWCLPCAPGFFCNMSGQDAPVGLCAQGYYCTGRTKTAKPEDGVTGGVCPRGHFCPPGSAAPSPCPSGEYNNATGQGKCFPCPAGFHCPKGLRRRCPPGFYCPQKTGLNFHPCPPGTHNPSHGLSQAEGCQQCPAGMFCGDWGLSSPSGPCWPGFFCTAGASVPNPNGAKNASTGGPCPPGHFCPAGSSIPQPCPAGTYSDRLHVWQDSSCTVCPSGSYCNSAGLTAPSGLCSAGYYCLSGASSPSPAGVWEKGGPCPVSHFCPEGTSFPLPCLAGTYNNLTRQAACFPCAAGYYCPENTSSYSTNPCPAGFYCPKGTRFATEFPCPRGYYNPDPMTQSLDSCLPCPPGHYCGKENLTGVSGKCDAGWFCVSAAWTSQPFDLDNYTNANCLCPATATGGKCLAGFYCPKGSPEPLPCPPGFYCNASGLSVPSGQCTAGFYCKGGAALPQPTDGATGNICPVGTYCTAASAAPRLCPAGTFSSLPGRRMLSECQPCPSGFYCKVPGLSVPTGECWEGYYCDSQQGPVIDFTLYPCPQGFYCPPGTRQSTQYSCPAGTFGPRQKLTTVKQCQRCPPGKYCEFSGLAAPTGACAEGFWCKSGARVRNPRDGESGLPCPPGHYCPEGAPLPLQCPPGTWSDSEGGRNLQECQPCPGGYYCNSSGLRAPSGHCSPGYYCVSGAQTPAPTDGLSGAPCPIRHFCPLGSRSPAPCPPGSYMPQTHGEECHACAEGEYCVPGEKPQPCPQGFYCPGGTGLDWQPCPPGTYSPEQGQGSRTSCRACDGGKFCQYHNATAVTGECWEGYYCTQGSYKPNPDAVIQGRAGPCPAGHYCPRGTSVPTPCPVGTFSSRSRMSSETQCSPCLPGHYCDAAGLPAPTGQCAEGFYCTLGSTLPNFPVVDKAGGPCPRGYFCPKGTAVPMACPAGSYNPSQRQASCLPCAKGFFCPENSSSFLENECSTGHYCPAGTASPTQFPCPKGTYNPQTRSSLMSHCTPCDPGHYCAFAGQSRVTGPCLAGFYCSRGVSSPAPTDGLLGNKCPKGTYCPMGSAFPQPCPLGYYSNSTGNTRIEDCLLCDAGHFCNGTGLSSPSGLCEAGFYCSGGALSPKPPRTTVSGGPCPPGHYCAVGSSRAQPCPAGSYSPSWSMAQCLECPEGFYCKTASTDYTDCPAGHYCPKSTEFATQYPCPPGTYSEALNIWDVSKCQLCPPGRVCSKPGLARPDGLCMPGWFCPPGSTSSKPVFPGSHSGVASAASGSVGLCQAGTFCPAGSFLPVPCTPGLYCATAELAAPSGPCEAGFYCTRGSMLPNPMDGAVGNVCPRGHFCPAGSSSPSPCPRGSFLAHRGGQSVQDCQACFPGWFCSQRGQSSPEGLCKEGWFCPEGSVSGQRSDCVCPLGHYCPTGSPEPTPCPSGKYQDQTGKSQCKICPAGMFCARKDQPEALQEDFSHGVVKPVICPAGHYCLSGTKAANQYPCPEGTFSNQTGLRNPRECRPCPGGTFCATAGLLTPSGPCLPGYYCTLKARLPNPVNDETGDLCPAGHFCPPGSSKPELCPAGTFLPQSGMVFRNACLLCPGGKFCQGEGLASVSGTCYAGYFCDVGSTEPNRKHCPPGSYCPEGSESPVPCSPGSFNSDSGKWQSTDCQLCPAGYFCSGSGAHTPELCPAGYFCLPGTNFSTEHPCPRGTFGTRAGATSESDCEPCPAGTYCSAPGLSQPSGFCRSGYHCTKGAISPAPFKHRVESAVFGLPGNNICPVGHFCPAGTGYPIPCPPGSFSASLGLEAEEQCQPCPAGRYCSGAGLSNLAQTSLCNAGYVCLEGNSSPSPSDRIHGYRCPSGFYCPAGTGLELPCEPGTFSPVPGANVCLPCPAGMTCSNAATVKPLHCPRGYYCPIRTAAPLPCPEGTLNPVEGSLSPAACKLCPVGRYCRGDANWEPDGLCPAGYYCGGGATDAIPHRTPGFPLSGPCPLGHYCPEGTHVPVACPVGTLNNATGGTSPESCVPCYPGSFCASAGLSSPTGPCTEGFYCPADFSSFSPTAFLCPKGHFCPLGAAHPMPCPAGEYQPTRGSASCVPCRRGSYCQEAVAGDPKRCPPHAYCPTGTQVPHPCPEGTFTLSNMTGLWNEKECLACLPGHYCRHGRLEGKCAAGYFCLAGSSQSTPQGHSFPWSFLSECRWGQVCAGLCPAGFYCQEGSEVPVPCPANTIRNIPGAKQREDCLPCPPGHWCKAGDSEAYPCPSGHYCFGGNDTDHGSLLAPQKCPPHTYRKYPGARSLADCQPCPPGYLCPLSGLTSFEDHPCPLGHWCPGRGDVFLCPPGTSRIQPGATSLEECDSCSPGYYCPDPAQTGLPNTQGVPCKPGYECPPGSVNPIPCRPGSYCGARTAVPSLCPGGYYCPEGSSTYRSPEQLCVFPYYCPPGSARPLLCEGGYMALSLPGPRDSFEKFCRICDAGTYRSDSLITAACQPCPAGFICPQGSKSYHQQPCPRGYYCPPLVPAPLPCPPGTHGSSNFAKRIEECQACPAGSFNHLPAQPACFPCGSSSSSRPGAASCTCHGLNRAFQQSDASCICQAGYVYYDERGKKNPDSNSDQDCQPQVDELCAPGEVRLASTRQCVFPEQYDCSTSCGPAGGEINAELGICHCKHYVSAEELCDQACLLRAPQISLRFGINRELLLRMDEGEEREVTNVLGPDEHVHESQQVRLVLFSPSGVLGFIVSSTDVLDAFLTGDLASDTFLQKGHRGRKASSRGIAALPLVPNPIVCLETGDAVLFQLSINPHNRASSHYPVYQKLHLYNSNPGWDFGPFRRLDHLVRETHLNISWFAHVFLDSGTYVFRDRTIQEHFLIVTVNEAHVGCDPRGVSFQPSSPFQLARHGVLKHQELNLAPNWAAIAVVLLVLGFLIVAFTTLAIVLQSPDPTLSPLKSWKPRWRSLGEPHVPPEYVLVKDSLQFCPVLGPRGSGEGAGLGEKGAARNAEEHFALRDLEDFSVRTMYDKLEDQNLHLASQLAKHRMDVLVFYKGVSQQLRGLMDMVQALDSEGLNNFARQRVCGHRTSDSLGAEKHDDSSNNFQAVMHTGAQWQEATELMKALKFLLGRAQHKNATVKREMEEQVPGQDVVAGSTRTSEGKAEVMDGQDPDLPPQCELCSRKPTFFSFPGHEETGLDPQLACLSELEVEGLIAASPLAKTLCEIKQALVKLQQPSDLITAEKCLSDSSSENTGSTLVPTDLASLSPYQFIVYRFGCAVLRLLIRTYSCPALVLKLARSVPARSPDQDVLPVLRDSHYDAINRYLYIRATRLEDAGEFIAILLSAVAWIKAGSASRGIVHSCFLTELNGAVVVLANASFQHLWEAAEKDPSGGSLSAHFDPQTMLEELLSIRVSPYPYVKEKALGERLQQYRCLQLPLESENRMENSQKREDSRSVGSSDFKLKAAKLEETLDELNEEFFELTVQALRSQEEGELLEQVLRTQEESTVTASIDHVYEAQCFPELLDSWATKRDEALLLEIQRSCIAQRIEEAEAELFYLLQNKIAASSLH